jgi:hypothetical protein
MSNFSNNKPNTTPTALFKKHYSHEVSSSLTDSQHIANDYSSVHRYQHRAHVVVVGHPHIRPYDPIYLDGLPNGMSGYWTVLSVEHIFGGSPLYYQLRLEVGTDVIGDINPDANKNAGTRDIQSDLAGQSLSPSGATLNEFSTSPNASTVSPTYGVTSPTAQVSKTAVTIPTVAGATAFKDAAPNLSGIKKTVQWVAKSSGKVLK